MLGHLANVSVPSCTLWPVLLPQQKPKLCFRQLPAIPVSLEETENIILLNKLFCKCFPADLCGNFTGECFAQHGVQQHSQTHAGLSSRREVLKFKSSSHSQTWGTWENCHYKEGHPEQLTRMTSPTLLWQQRHFSREHRHFASPLFTRSFLQLQVSGTGHKEGSLSISPSKLPSQRSTLQSHFNTDPGAFARNRPHLQRGCWQNSQTHAAHRATLPRSPSPQTSAKPRASCQTDQTCKDDFVLYSKEWQLGKIWTGKNGLDC